MVFQNWNDWRIGQQRETARPEKIERTIEPQKQKEQAEQVRRILQSFLNRNGNNPEIPPLGVSKTSLALAKRLLGDEVKSTDSEEDIYNNLLKKFNGDIKKLEKFLKEAESNPNILSDEGADAFLAIEDQYADYVPETYYSSDYYGINFGYDPLLVDALLMLLEGQQEVKDYIFKLEEEKKKEEKIQEEINKEKAEEKRRYEKELAELRLEKINAQLLKVKAALEGLNNVQSSLQNLGSGEPQDPMVLVGQIDEAIQDLSGLLASIEVDNLGLADKASTVDVISNTISNLEKVKTNIQSRIPEAELEKKEIE